MTDPVRFPRVKIFFTFLMGVGLAFQALSPEEKDLFGEFATPIVSLLLGGIYGVEKYLLKAPEMGKKD